MEITCAQMDVLISFYLEGDLSKQLKEKVEEHLKKCSICKTKYEIIKSMLNDLRNTFNENDDDEKQKTNHFSSNSSSQAISQQYRVFKNNLSAYVDNELTSEENIKIKKFAINNKNARQDLEDVYNIRRIMNESFDKTRTDLKQDFSKDIVKQLDINGEHNLEFHPFLKFATAFVFTVLSLSAIVIFSLTL